MEGIKMTGYPSIDQPWLRYYKEEDYAKALDTPKDKSIYGFFMENAFSDPNFPVLKYFNSSFSATQFVEMINTWAKAFRAVGIHEDEMVPIYGTWCPEIAAIFFALNAIGAHPYFEKLDITEDALRAETKGAEVGVVFEPLWNEISKKVFSEDRFRIVFMICLADSMSFPLKQILNLKSLPFKKSCSGSYKYVFLDQVKKLAASYSGPLEAPFKSGRIALITTSSGTTSSVVKGIVDTNESALANLMESTGFWKPKDFAGRESLITLPPTASTAINCFFLFPLYHGMTVRLDPRADEENWTKLLLKYKPFLALNTGALWYSFYRRVAKLIDKGKKVDLQFAETFVMGGSGVTPEQLAFMNDIAEKCNAPHHIISGYGCSEYFGVITAEKYEVNHTSVIKDAISVGIPIPGCVLSVFDENGNEMTYGQRGEIRVKGPAIMEGYFNKPELTAQTLENGWLKTGDVGELDDNGYVYVHGRKKDSIVVKGEIVYLFDLANALRREFNLDDCMVESKKLANGSNSIVVYYVENKDENVKQVCQGINAYMKQQGIEVDGYLVSKEAFPISPTTLKPQKRVLSGFVNFLDSGEIIDISYLPVGEDIYKKTVHCT